MYFHILSFLFFFQPFASPRPSIAGIVFQSRDGGQTWQDVSAGLPYDFQAGSVFTCSDKVFLGSESEMYRSSIVSAVPIWEKDILLPGKITGFFPGLTGPYVCSYESGLFQNIPGTDIWSPMHHALRDKTVRSVLETPDGAVFVGCNSGIFKSADDGKTWKQVFSEGMVMSLVAADGVLIGGGFRGVLRSADGGEHWDWVLTEDGATVQTGLIEGGVAAISYDGLTKRLRTSADSGKTWHLVDEHLTSIQFIDDIKQAGEYLFCRRDAGIFRSSDKGKTWELVFPSTGKKWLNLAVSDQVIYVVMMEGC